MLAALASVPEADAAGFVEAADGKTSKLAVKAKAITRLTHALARLLRQLQVNIFRSPYLMKAAS